jgi:hypothetical protein
MFELLANYKDLKTITWTETSATASGGPYGCMPTYSNWNCVISPAPSASPPPPTPHRRTRSARERARAVRGNRSGSGARG